MDFTKLAPPDSQHYIIRSTWIPNHDRHLRLNIVVMTYPLSQVWEANIGVETLEKAWMRDREVKSLEEFEVRMRYALRGGVDERDRRTESVVREDSRGKSLSLIVFPDKEGLIEFELLSIPLTESRPEKRIKVWSTCMEYLVRELNTSRQEMNRLNAQEGMLVKDLKEVREDFDRWVSGYREKAEAQVFRKFRDVLNEKKKKIRELLKALEFQESTRKRAEEELTNRVVKIEKTRKRNHS
ncbi:hypothetical protein BC829DRAFT_99485 [Chytridium lagenaria]|nr:hypothetical protein BC829DRAFT_99485 [Chytridium lagenaria]